MEQLVNAAAVSAAMTALSSLTKGDIAELKAFAKPPGLVIVAMEAVCVLLGRCVGWDFVRCVLASRRAMRWECKILASVQAWMCRRMNSDTPSDIDDDVLLLTSHFQCHARSSDWGSAKRLLGEPSFMDQACL